MQVDDLVEAAAGLISVLDELRPLEPATFNPAYEIWKAIAAVPPADRSATISAAADVPLVFFRTSCSFVSAACSCWNAYCSASCMKGCP
jgi:hypothetical protein